jgi:hypothetical protein
MVMGQLLPAATIGDPGPSEQFRNLMLSDSQLVEKIRKAYPDFEATQQVVEGRNVYTGAPEPARDCWLVSFTEGTEKRSLAIPIEGGKSWEAYRYALYCCYVHLMSGGGS